MSKQVSIRRATLADVAAISLLAGELGYAVDAKKMRRHVKAILASKADLLLVAVGAGSPVGWIQAHASHVVESGFRIEIMGLIVSAKARRIGVGRDLVARVEDWAQTLSAPAVVVRSNASRLESHQFYPALGYAVAKTQVVYRKVIKN
jgi:predicted N-acetyltransferase YhbS